MQVSLGWAETICPSLAGPFMSLFPRGRAADAGPASPAGCSQSFAEPFQTIKALKLPDFPLPYLPPRWPGYQEVEKASGHPDPSPWGPGAQAGASGGCWWGAKLCKGRKRGAVSTWGSHPAWGRALFLLLRSSLRAMGWAKPPWGAALRLGQALRPPVACLSPPPAGQPWGC